MSTPGGLLLGFFTQFNFQKYTYDPHTPPLEEFERLCQARQWGASKIRKHESAFLLALETEKDLRTRGSAGPNVIEFFRKYEYPLFAYDLDAPIQLELGRLVGLRGWGEAKLSKVMRQFNKAVELDTREQSIHGAADPAGPEDQGTQEVDLIADWLREQECRGYRYRGAPPECEFRKLAGVKYREWKRDVGGDFEDWKDSPEFETLHTEFYEVVEDAFNFLLGKFCQITGFTPWQVLAGLYGQKWANIGKSAAKTFIKRVFINIFDFLDAFTQILKNPPTSRRKLSRLLKHTAVKLRFPNDLMLGVYSALTHRVFPVRRAKQGGTLALLLHNIGVFLRSFGDVVSDFKQEAGDELHAAEREGPAGVRRLLLSREWDSLGNL